MKETLEIAAYVATIVASMVALAYLVFTYKIMQANRLTVEVMHKQLELMVRPYVVIDAFTNPGDIIIRLRIRNLGASGASNLRLLLSQSFHKFGEHSPEYDISTLPAFTNTILAFAPKAELVFNLARSFDVFGERASKNLMPEKFSITALYEFGSQRFEEPSHIDLGMFKGSAVSATITDQRLTEINKSLDGIKSEIHSLHRDDRRSQQS